MSVLKAKNRKFKQYVVNSSHCRPCMTFITNGACRIMNIKFKTAGKDDIDCISVKNGNVMFQNCEFSTYTTISVT